MTVTLRNYMGLLTLLFLAACESNQDSQQSSSITQYNEAKQQVSATKQSRESGDQLTQAEAQDRKSRVSNVEYILDVDLISLADAYQGKVSMSFELSSSAEDLTIDFTGGSVVAAKINGKDYAVDYSGFFITLPAAELITGNNEVIIQYQHPYDQDGTGLHRFVDPEDGKTYLYTYLWPYYANRLFPHFDQPNLKATYELTVRANADWHVVSAMKEDLIEEDGDAKIWHFPRSQKFSSYIFSLHAGPYKMWQDKAGDIPIRLFARQSLAQYVPVEEWMAYTKMGLDHYKTYFDINYPFGKYDQLLVPDFNIGAMENVAAVTFAEFVIQKGPSNRFERQRRADIILHEMAHMWFGNLVTKNWWNGLWLNESFASLMASIATSELPEFKDFWHDFYLGTTLLAIDADNKVSTHPIEMPVPSTNDFFSVFDTITYEKGSSVLNQLSHLVGQENFRLGVSKYLKKHAWSNTELIDFIAAQSEQSGQDLEYWSEEWLYQAGVNSIAANFQCDQGNVTEFKVLQTASEELPTLRSQLTQLALFDPDMNISFVKAIKIVGASTDIAEVIGKPCPYMVFPNYQGWGYVEVKLDEVSKGHIIEAINKSNDPMLRSMLWTTVFSESDIDFEQVIHALDSENNDRVIGQVQRKLIEKLNLMERQGRPNVMTVGQSIESLLWRKLNTAGKGDSLSMIMLQDYVNVVRTASGQNNLLGLLSGNINLPEVTLSQDNRWSIIHRMAVLNHKNINDLLDHETMNDPSDGGKLGAIAAEAALPDLANKKAWIKQFMVNENAMPFSQQRVAMENLFPANQTQFQEELLPDLVAALPVIGQTRDNYYQRSYAESLFHGVCSDSAINTINTVLDKEQLGTTLYRFLSENLQLAQECLAGVNQ